MDFFEHQERARRKTTLLVAYFLLAIVLIIAAIYAVFAYVFMPVPPPDAAGSALAIARNWWRADLLMLVATITIGIIILGSLYKIITLSQGGEAVARMLGARLVPPATTDLQERRLLNVVEEIALASGTPVPRVFVLDNENSVNAFAAGFSTRDAVIGVTFGCLTQLTRDELQGVIAHEFSHILNGDMRLNLRLMGLLNGILIISIIGYWIFRIAASTRRTASVGRKKGGSPIPFILVGLAVMAIGYIGVFFGKLIKSAVSRQREFLADAASVQFTRNPDGLAGALKKIGGFVAGSRIQNPNAEEASHLFFANGLGQSFLNLMATHPPLVERIRRIDPAFSGDFAAVNVAPVAGTNDASAAITGFAQASASRRDTATEFSHPATIPLRPYETLQSVGQPQAENLAYVTTLLNALPEAIKTAAREPIGARALIYGLLISTDELIRNAQLQVLTLKADADVAERTRALAPELASLPAAARMPLTDMALTALRALSRAQAETFRDNLRALIEADATISLFEYMLERMVVRRLASQYGRPRRVVVQYYDLKPLLPAATTLLSTLAYYGQPKDDQAVARAFQSGAARLNSTRRLLPRESCGLAAADQALTILNTASPAIKKTILDACVACVAADGRTTVTEAELLRSVADALDCPIPPFVPDAE
ncbi:MAG: M48 family metallopeptidase [Verrucomicrobia bacterium]|nr:M48 family metallopeptidase [Verrucomicrobiota bacterium]MBU1733861.1 M48 family metallopeptidase [Verrucomicrobiota bacterium]MBU1856313.1 M48 family metallopeptidase [Verrucomicrobiota bacterium]